MRSGSRVLCAKQQWNDIIRYYLNIYAARNQFIHFVIIQGTFCVMNDGFNTDTHVDTLDRRKLSTLLHTSFLGVAKFDPCFKAGSIPSIAKTNPQLACSLTCPSLEGP